MTHRFSDTFTLIGSAEAAGEFEKSAGRRSSRLAWMNRQNWLVLDERANTGRRLKSWMDRQGCQAEPGMQLPGFDLIINLVALGMGVSFVPVRALALSGQGGATIQVGGGWQVVRSGGRLRVERKEP